MPNEVQEPIAAAQAQKRSLLALPGLDAIYRDGKVDVWGLIVCTIGTIALTRLSSLLTPFNLYFTFADLVESQAAGYSILPFFIKMLIPFSVGFCYFVFSRGRDPLDPVSANSVNFELTAAVGCGFGAAILSWPAIVQWELIVRETLFTFRLQFILVYFLYVISFIYLGCAGVLIARLVAIQGQTPDQISPKLKQAGRYVTIVWSLLAALATGGIADWIAKQVTNG